MKVRISGYSGAIAKGSETISFVLVSEFLVDADSCDVDLSLKERTDMTHVFFKYLCLDHIAELPRMQDAVVARQSKPLNLYASPETLESVKKHIFSVVVWHEFTGFINLESSFLQMASIDVAPEKLVSGLRLEALPANHTVPTLDWAVSQSDTCRVLSGHMESCLQYSVRVNQPEVGLLVIETASSSREIELAKPISYLASDTLVKLLTRLHRKNDNPISMSHTKSVEIELNRKEIEMLRQSESAAAWGTGEIHCFFAGREFAL